VGQGFEIGFGRDQPEGGIDWKTHLLSFAYGFTLRSFGMTIPMTQVEFWLAGFLIIAFFLLVNLYVREDRDVKDLDERLKKIEGEKKDALLMFVEQLQQRIQTLESRRG
jgi:hypothetical protein